MKGTSIIFRNSKKDAPLLLQNKTQHLIRNEKGVSGFCSQSRGSQVDTVVASTAVATLIASTAVAVAATAAAAVEAATAAVMAATATATTMVVAAEVVMVAVEAQGVGDAGSGEDLKRCRRSAVEEV